MQRTRVRLIVWCLAASVVAGCAGERPRAANDGLEVVASFYPVWEAASRIGGDEATVHNLTPAGVEPHDLELTADALDRIIEADVVLYLGQGFQPVVEEAVDRATGATVDLLDGLELHDPTDDGHADEEGHESEAADPHVWLDPRTWAQVVGRIERVLADAVSDAEASAIHERASAYGDTIAELDGAFAEGLDDCASDTIVTSHAAFGYLAERYGLEQVAISGLSPEAEPSPKRLAEIADLVERERITTIFSETLVSPRVAETLAREADVKTAVLDPIEGLTVDQIDARRDYVGVMRDNLRVLQEALQCR